MTKVTDMYKFARIILIWVAIGQLFTIIFIIFDRGYQMFREIKRNQFEERHLKDKYVSPTISSPILSETEV